MDRATNALNLIKSNWLALNMVIGAVGYKFLYPYTFLLPYLIFLMLFFTFLSIDIKNIKWKKLFVCVLSVQWIGGVVLYFILYSLFKYVLVRFQTDCDIIAQGGAMCVVMPTASASPIVTKKIGGDVYISSSFMILSNIASAVFFPIFFTTISSTDSISIFLSMLAIFKRTGTVLLLPLFLAFVIRTMAQYWKRRYAKICFSASKQQTFSNAPFYIWGGTVIILTAEMVHTLVENYYATTVIVFLVILSACICYVQFKIGRRVGEKYDNASYATSIAYSQSVGQKNTTLGIWLSQIYLAPLAFLASATYMIWQNIMNNRKIAKYEQKTNKSGVK